MIVLTDTNKSKVTPSGSVHLDALRGAAALLVFANHTRALYFTSALDSAPTAGPTASQIAIESKSPAWVGAEFAGEIKFASEAVVIFFVLSGYLVGGSVLRSIRSGRWSWRSYLSKRLTRLYIVLIPALLIGMSLDYIGWKIFGPGSVYTGPAGIGLVTTWHFVERFRFSVFFGNALFLENFIVPYAGTNVSLWSLANEFWYYMAFPLLVLATTAGRKWLTRLLLVAAGIGLMIFTGPSVSLVFPVWIFGALVSLLPRKFSNRQAKIFSSVMTVVLLASMVGVRIAHMRTIFADYILGIVTSVLIYCIIQQLDAAKDGIYKTVSHFFSKISYTLYLFHVPMAMFLCGMVNSPWHHWERTPKHLALYALNDCIIVVLAYALWWLFEARTDALRVAIFAE